MDTFIIIAIVAGFIAVVLFFIFAVPALSSGSSRGYCRTGMESIPIVGEALNSLICYIIAK